MAKYYLVQVTDHNESLGVKLLSVFLLHVSLPGVTIPTHTTPPVAVEKENISLNVEQNAVPWQSLGLNNALVTIIMRKRQNLYDEE